MRSSHAALGASLLALAAANAAAQTSTIGTNSWTVEDNGFFNRADVDNSAAGNDRNGATIRFDGNNNLASITQIGEFNSALARFTGDANTSTLRQTGRLNRSSSLQTGGQNSSRVDQHLDPALGRADSRWVTLEQRGPGNSSTIVQRWQNRATVIQGTPEMDSLGARSELLQNGALNVAEIQMEGGQFLRPNVTRVEQTPTDTIETRSQVTMYIRGEDNISEVYQIGSNISGLLIQRGIGNRAVSRSTSDMSYSGIGQEGDNNSASAFQTGIGNRSDINQGTGTLTIAGNRVARLQQVGSANASVLRQRGANNEAAVTQGIARLPSTGNDSSIDQASASNLARVAMFEGDGEFRNLSTIFQGSSDGGATFNVADVAIRGISNYSTVMQWGRRLSADVTMLGGKRGADEIRMRFFGNSSYIYQDGAGHSATIVSGSFVPDQGMMNHALVQQFGPEASVANRAAVWQRGHGDRVEIWQRIRGSQDDGGSLADVSQLGRENVVNLRQIGHHSATVTQGLGEQSVTAITQYDSGGGPDASGDENQRAAGAVFIGNNEAGVAQYGVRNSIQMWQEGSRVAGTIWQKIGSSDNRLNLNQGKRSTMVEGATQCSSGCQFASGASANVTQDGRLNSATINQYAASRAVVEQLGRSSAGTPNTVLVTQTGSGNSGSVRQAASVGPSAAGDPASGNSAAQNQQQTGNASAAADEFYFAGGARRAEARLLQLGTNSTASIEQRGLGQFALIQQRGTSNAASILQDLGATNATAVIRQDGSGNSYSITQTQAGQYMVVTQNGSNNAVTDVVRRGPGS
jgi:hypothetical protein